MDCPIDSLPDGLLGYIMTLTGMQDRASLVLVSHRWKRVFLSEPGLWRLFTMLIHRSSETREQQSQRLKRRAALLRLVAPHVVRFRWEEHTDKWRLAATRCLERCLAALSSSQLAELQLSGPCISLAGAPAAAALRQLSSRVTSLSLGACLARPASVVLAALSSQLHSLQVSTAGLPPELLGSIVQLRQLTALRIETYAWPDLSSLTRLSRLRQLVLVDVRVGGPGRMQPPMPASFPAGLERFSFHCKYRTFKVAGCMLFTFRLWQGSTAGFSTDEGAAQELPLPTLALGCSSLSPPLPQLLSSLQPAGAPARLYRGLTSLELSRQGLAELPAGEYLTGLHSLDLSRNEFVLLPPAITRATALTHLGLDGNSQLVLSTSERAALLALPCLQQLDMEG
ncbi:L domain [Chlorella sorokiniana]|uniref:L domain n=1 Tax=Chlorella sorokiniana TaxID=3076 RepID=A0A2P6TKE7_CHLSO|nr:L domain [Chlorella sorokiniana]|eukprot:PRW44546.1 L domain [Chlorella sorokiniana]